MSGDRGIWKISVPFPYFCCEPKTSVKKFSLNMKKKCGEGHTCVNIWHLLSLKHQVSKINSYYCVEWKFLFFMQYSSPRYDYTTIYLFVFLP